MRYMATLARSCLWAAAAGAVSTLASASASALALAAAVASTTTRKMNAKNTTTALTVVKKAITASKALTTATSLSLSEAHCRSGLRCRMAFRGPRGFGGAVRPPSPSLLCRRVFLHAGTAAGIPPPLLPSPLRRSYGLASGNGRGSATTKVFADSVGGGGGEIGGTSASAFATTPNAKDEDEDDNVHRGRRVDDRRVADASLESALLDSHSRSSSSSSSLSMLRKERRRKTKKGGMANAATIRLKKGVIVRRNRQSMSFRIGSPLVFTGAIESTYEYDDENENDENCDVEKKRQGTGLRMGDLVLVSVTSEDTDEKTDKRGVGGGRNGGNKKSYKNKGRHSGKSKRNKDEQGDDGNAVTHVVLDSSYSSSAAATTVRSARPIGIGVYNPRSMYRVRILCHEATQPLLFRDVRSILSDDRDDHDEEYDYDAVQARAIGRIVEHKLRSAVAARAAIGLPWRSFPPSLLEQTNKEVFSKEVGNDAVQNNFARWTASTDTYRLVNGEGDGLSGLAVDVLGGRVAVVVSSAAWCELYRQQIEDALQKVLPISMTQPSSVDGQNEEDGKIKTMTQTTTTVMDVVWRTAPSRLDQDGYRLGGGDRRRDAVEQNVRDELDDDDNDDDEEEEEEEEENVKTQDESVAEDNRCVIVTESGVKYKTYPYRSRYQKTGFYCDQRTNRLDLASLCTSNDTVLDLCCYNGAFALTSLLLGRARHATGVDSSPDAISYALDNAFINGLSDDRYDFVRSDVTTFMKDAHDNGRMWDVVILDPPKLAPSIKSLDRAARKYRSLNRDAMKLVNAGRGGLLLTCTCSAAMTQRDGGNFFLRTVRDAALSAGRTVRLLRTTGAAPCHVLDAASYPAGAYLTAALFHVGPVEGGHDHGNDEE